MALLLCNVRDDTSAIHKLDMIALIDPISAGVLWSNTQTLAHTAIYKHTSEHISCIHTHTHTHFDETLAYWGLPM